jgi:hypothetical protein
VESNSLSEITGKPQLLSFISEKQKTRLIVALGIITALLFLCFVRMALFHYYTTDLGMLGPQLLRHDRLTGQTALYCKGHGWQKIEITEDTISLPGGTEVFIGSQGIPLDIALRWVVGIALLCVAGFEFILVRSRAAERKRESSPTAPI